MTRNIHYVTIVFFIQENKSFGAQLFALILCQYVADIMSRTDSTHSYIHKNKPCPDILKYNRHRENLFSPKLVDGSGLR